MANLSNDSEIQSGIPVKSSSRQNSLTKYVNVNRNFWPWDHGPITQKRVDELLSASADGIFLVHDNPELPGEHILSVQYSGEVHHYRMKWLKNYDRPDAELCLTVDDKNFFNTMSELISYYSNHGNLCTLLVQYLPRPTDDIPPSPEPYVSGTRPPRSLTPIELHDEDSTALFRRHIRF